MCISSSVFYVSKHTGNGKQDFSFEQNPVFGEKKEAVLRQALRKLFCSLFLLQPDIESPMGDIMR